MIRVWTNENCVQCDQTKRFLDKAEIEYLTLDLSQNPDDLKRFKDMGFMSAPVVETSNDIWSGFRLEKLKSLEIEVNQ